MGDPESSEVGVDPTTEVSREVLEQTNELGTLRITLGTGTTVEGFDDSIHLDIAIGAAKDLTAATPSSDEARSSHWFLISLLLDRFRRTGSLDDLHRFIKFAKEAVAATPTHHHKRPSMLNKLSLGLNRRYEQLGDLEDLQQAIKLAEEALEAIPRDHPYQASYVNNLSKLFICKYERLGALEDLERAINLAEQVVAATSPDHSNRPGRLSNLSNFFSRRYERLGVLEDLQRAINLAEEAVTATPPDNTNRPGILSNLSTLLIDKYKQLGALEDLQRAINLAEEAVAATPPGDTDYPPRLSNLSYYFSCRYHRQGSLEDLQRSINLAEEAVAATPKDHTDRPIRLNNLSIFFTKKYQRLGALEDLQQATDLGKEALAATPEGHIYRPCRLNNLSISFGIRYERLRALEDLQQAINLAEEAVEAAPSDYTDRHSILGNLNTFLSYKYERLASLEDLQRAINLAEEAVAATPLGHINRPEALSNLSNRLKSRSVRLGDREDLDQAIILAEEARAEAPLDQPVRADILIALGDCLSERSRQTPSHEDFEYSLRIYREAWDCDMSPPSIRISGARKAATLLATVQRWQECSLLLDNAVRMLPKVSPRVLERDDQEKMLSEFSRLAAEAASVALQAGAKASDCLTLLELGRGIIMGLTIDCRSDLSELQIEDPVVSAKFNLLRTEIDTPLECRGHIDKHRRRRRVQAIHEMEETLAYIRTLPNFERFQLPPAPEDLIAIAREGPIVVFNCTYIRSDAIIVTDTDIKTLPLPKLLFGEVTERMRRLSLEILRGRRTTYPSRNTKMAELLLWLWDVAVGPVLEYLHLNVIMSHNELTRIWWIGVGPLSMAPFHAAGDHSSGSTRNTISQAISSYIPTIKALSYARQKALEPMSESRLLLVTMPTTPGAKSLPNATKEVEEIIGIVQGRTVTARLDSPSANEVLGKLPSYHTIHFSCHGVSVGETPSNSHLLLLKDDGSGTVDQLTVGAISNTNIKHAQLAYLSACCTADNPSVALADESIHIASGFHLAGFSHVLATLWESNDLACRQVARDFYKLLFNSQGSGEGHRGVSTAFHNAVKNVREEYLKQPIKWASFIHTGA